MPDYKSHSIHSEIVLSNINKRVLIHNDDIKKFSFGPDALLTTDYQLFDYQHSHNTKDYFECIIFKIKKYKLQDDEKVMAFLYGQLDHFVLDLVIHPLIYYMTENMPAKHKIKPHALIEMWIDDYVMHKFNKGSRDYYIIKSVISNEVAKIIDETYSKIYNRTKISPKYEAGIYSITNFDKVRYSKSEIIKKICKALNIGDLFYSRNLKRVTPYLNLDRKIITNPVTGESFKESFDDLWDKSIMMSSELIEDVNNHIYRGTELKNHLIKNNISYNTGFPCTKKEVFRYVKKYKPLKIK